LARSLSWGEVDKVDEVNEAVCRLMVTVADNALR
jgi:hypothetical protein